MRRWTGADWMNPDAQLFWENYHPDWDDYQGSWESLRYWVEVECAAALHGMDVAMGRPTPPPVARVVTVDEDLGDSRSITRTFGGGCATCDGGGCGDCGEEA
ncbi:hypothetical protein PBI_ESTAVE1_92 [Mycobacterium phage Estave1]|uniref:Uncharacterized protein n=1 Tax=Mycobacterium phage Estave1 TaxID=1536603 RepID=A0A088F7L3_9CAUD|nr:hypothetical protein PBI_ESTAVE1_92 [Mycobacterium phage Estave1]AIM40482.1 hypothetical protein PBI_ESTAVE1_92 [Mycobacterium phage Estave1]QGJ93713.1 hypothetical protein SEA_HANNACONDA_72 [Mycobacterium phage Hannaconda]